MAHEKSPNWMFEYIKIRNSSKANLTKKKKNKSNFLTIFNKMRISVRMSVTRSQLNFLSTSKRSCWSSISSSVNKENTKCRKSFWDSRRLRQDKYRKSNLLYPDPYQIFMLEQGESWMIKAFPHFLVVAHGNFSVFLSRSLCLSPHAFDTTKNLWFMVLSSAQEKMTD